MAEYTKHPTQKPLSISNRIVKVHSEENDLVYIPFAGSGSEIVSCIKNNRNWIATELEEKYINEIIVPRIKGDSPRYLPCETCAEVQLKIFNNIN